jgi:hypothetical protein
MVFVVVEIVMRIAAFLSYLFLLPAVAGAQVGVVPGPAANPYQRPSFFVGPSYRNTSESFYAVPRSTHSPMRDPRLGLTFSGSPMLATGAATPQNHATYFRNPYYPSLNFTAPTDIRPPQYVIPPVTRTPLHDPYFEERVYEEFDDAYETWGW